MSAKNMNRAFENATLFLWDRANWDHAYKLGSVVFYLCALQTVAADIHAFEARGHMFEPPIGEI